MKRTIIIRTILTGLCIFALAGCGQSGSDTPRTPVQSDSAGGSSGAPDTSGSNSGGSIIDSAALTGNVIDFSDSGCSVSQAQKIEGGAALKSEAEGQENKENAVTVNYSADCEFLLAELNTQAEDLTNVTRGSVSDIKKQSIVYVYGNFIDAHNLNADKIIIARFEQR